MTLFPVKVSSNQVALINPEHVVYVRGDYIVMSGGEHLHVADSQDVITKLAEAFAGQRAECVFQQFTEGSAGYE